MKLKRKRPLPTPVSFLPTEYRSVLSTSVYILARGICPLKKTKGSVLFKTCVDLRTPPSAARRRGFLSDQFYSIVMLSKRRKKRREQPRKPSEGKRTRSALWHQPHEKERDCDQSESDVK